MSFVHLHNHSEYSMLDGLAKVKRMAKHAAEQGMPAIAITDHGVMHGAIEFSDACADAGVKPIIGMEAYLTKRGRRMSDRDNNIDRSPHHLLLLAMNQAGYKNLMRLATLSQLEGFYYKPRIDHDALAEFSDGIICTSGCPSAEVPRLILEGKHDLARQYAQWYLDIFKDRFYFEIQEHDLPEFRQVNDVVIAWAKELGVPVIATNDAHYVKREDAIPHDLMLCIQTTSLFTDPKRMKFNDDSYYLRTEAEMRAIFDPICPEAITNTVDLAARCDVKLKDKTFHLPHFKRPARFASDNDYMRYLCEIGFEVRYGIPAREDGTWTHEAQPPLPEDGFISEGARRMTHDVAGLAIVKRPASNVYSGEDKPIKLTSLSPLALPNADAHPSMTPRRLRERLQFEIDTIVAMGFPTYMLIVWDLIRFCREKGIWWDVRGSAAGSMVSHVLMLTNIEPVSNDLYFERFLNPERVTMPDIDMDFPDDQRHLLVDYTIEKYGKDNVAQIITFGTMAARAALKDIGRVLDIPLPEVNRVTQLVPAIPGKPVNLKEALEQVPELKSIYESEDHLRNLYDKAMLVEGAVRNAGTHAAGVVIADKPLIEYAPLHRLTGTPITPNLNAVTQFEMNHLENIGLLKMDYLGLSMLTIIRKACELIEQRRGKRYTLNDIPIHEKITYDVLSRGDVAGVFQVESTGMRNLMMQMKPQRFENIVAAISLYRPGPLEYIPTYIKRMHGEDNVVYHHVDLKPALEETYGIITYQEQIMRVARDFAGYSMGEADTIRKAVSKKVKEQLDKHKSKFRDGAVKKGYPAEVAEKIWSDIEFFARYGFNKSHAAIYASITCQTAYLKGKYPLEYFCALLSVESGNTEKITGLIGDAKQHGIKILPPSVNASMQDFTIEDALTKTTDAGRQTTASPSSVVVRPSSSPAIRFGLMAIKGVGSGPVEAIIEARAKGNSFRSLDDFCRRVDMTSMNKRALDSLIKVGAFDDFGTRPQLLAVVDQMIGNAVTARRAAERGQSMLFGGFDTAIETELITLPKNVKDIPRKQLLQEEKDLIGTYVSEHPLQASLDALQQQVTHNSSQLGPADNGQKVLMAGVISFIRPHTTKAGKAMAFGEMEDLYGRIELTIFPRTWDEYQGLLLKDKVVLIAGKAEVPEGGAAKILVERVSDTFEVARSADADATKTYYRADDRWDNTGSAGVSEDAIQAFYAMDREQASIADVQTSSVMRQVSAPNSQSPISNLQSLESLDDVSFVDDGEGAPLPAEGSIEADPAFAKPANADPSAFDDVSFNDDGDDGEAVTLSEPIEQVVQVTLANANVFAGSAALVSQPPIATSQSHPSSINPHPRAQDLPLIATREPLVVVMHRNGDSKSDVAKLEAVLQTLRKYEGEQPFVIALRNGGGKDMNIDFPNDTTRDCAELRAELTALLGAKCVQ
jgi:DNA polymerase-3 subunit alpha